MGTGLRNVIQRVRLIAPSSKIFRLTNRMICALESIAIHTDDDEPEFGCCKPAMIFGQRGGNKSKRTFQRASNDLLACGLIHKVRTPAKDGRYKYPPPTYFISMRLTEEAMSSTGYKGGELYFQAPFEPSGQRGDPPEIKSLKAKLQHATTAAIKSAEIKASSSSKVESSGVDNKQKSYP